MNRIRFVYFDAAGTLLRPARPVGQTYVDVAAHYGVREEAEAVEASFRAAFRSMMTPDHGKPSTDDDQSWWREVVQKTWEPFLPGLPERFPFEDYFQELYDVFARPGMWRVFGDVDVALERLAAAGIGAGVLSNWDRRLRRVLEGLDLVERLQPVIISSEHGVGKPRRRLFDIATEACGFPASAIALIGDEEAIDGAGARAAGWTYGHLDRRQHHLCDVLDEILK